MKITVLGGSTPPPSEYGPGKQCLIELKLCLFSHNKFHSEVNEHLLLAPSDGSIITEKDDYYIKEALFEFLATVDRSL